MSKKAEWSQPVHISGVIEGLFSEWGIPLPKKADTVTQTTSETAQRESRRLALQRGRCLHCGHYDPTHADRCPNCDEVWYLAAQ